MDFTLTSPAFADGEAIPVRHTCDGQNVSPALAWTDPPPGTAAFALVLDDPDAPGGTFTHWLLGDIPADARTLAEDSGAGAMGASGANDFGRTGYGGPCPPRGHGPHRYGFHLYALGRPLGVKPGQGRGRFDAALAAAPVLATATLGGRYERRA